MIGSLLSNCLLVLGMCYFFGFVSSSSSSASMPVLIPSVL
jgi:hypothetical protein